MLQPTDVSDYHEQLALSLISAKDFATQSIRKAQNQYKSQYDKKSTKWTYQVGDWVLVKFPAEESGKNRKLSQPWHGPYRVLSCPDPDVVVSKVYFPDDGQIQVHQLRVAPCPVGFPSGYYWYGRKKHSPGCMPKWLLTLNKKKMTSILLQMITSQTMNRLRMQSEVAGKAKKTPALTIQAQSQMMRKYPSSIQSTTSANGLSILSD